MPGFFSHCYIPCSLEFLFTVVFWLDIFSLVSLHWGISPCGGLIYFQMHFLQCYSSVVLCILFVQLQLSLVHLHEISFVSDTMMRQAAMAVKCVLLMYYRNGRGHNFRRQVNEFFQQSITGMKFVELWESFLIVDIYLGSNANSG